MRAKALVAVLGAHKKKLPTKKSTRLAISAVCFYFRAVAPAGYLSRYILKGELMKTKLFALIALVNLCLVLPNLVHADNVIEFNSWSNSPGQF